MSTHRHRAVESQTETRPFTGCLAGIDCDPVSHGNVCYIEHCKCGAWRAINSNAGHQEKTSWEAPEAVAGYSTERRVVCVDCEPNPTGPLTLADVQTGAICVRCSRPLV